MKVVKALLILALIIAAAVLIPLRRAQRAFASRTAVPAYAVAPRASLRRRPGHADRVAKPRVREEKATVIECAVRGRGTVRPPRRQDRSAATEHRRGASETVRQAPSLKDHARTVGGDDVAPWFVGPAPATRPPQPCLSASPVRTLAVASQADADTPVPPPRTSAL